MHKFQDKLGREWNIDLTVALARKVHRECGVDLLDEGEAGELPGLLTRKLALSNVVYSLIEDQAKAVGISQDDFFGALDSESLSASWNCLADSFVSFCLPANREAIQRVIEAQTEAMAETGKRMAAMASGTEAKAAIARAVEAAVSEATAGLEAIAK